MDRYRVGQRVIFKRCVLFPEVSGTVTTIAQGRRKWRCKGGVDLYAYILDLTAPNGVRFAATEEQLAPYYDGDEKTAWSDCAWQPKKQTA